ADQVARGPERGHQHRDAGQGALAAEPAHTVDDRSGGGLVFGHVAMVPHRYDTSVSTTITVGRCRGDLLGFDQIGRSGAASGSVTRETDDDVRHGRWLRRGLRRPVPAVVAARL